MSGCSCPGNHAHNTFPILAAEPGADGAIRVRYLDVGIRPRGRGPDAPEYTRNLRVSAQIRQEYLDRFAEDSTRFSPVSTRSRSQR